MKKNTKYIVLAAIFTVSVGTAFVLTKKLKDNVPELLQSENGDTLVIVRDTVTKESGKIVDPTPEKKVDPTPDPTPPIIKNKMTEGEIQRLLIHGNANPRSDKRLAKFIHISVQGRRDDDRPITDGDLMGVNAKIENDIWKTAIVTSVSYDEEGRLNRVTIRPMYPENTVDTDKPADSENE